jgi:D-glycero-D-manno-heptose 1,7-bisphosphate phosphatase
MKQRRYAVVLAGGLGTRIREVTGDLIPKALVPVLGKPFLYFKLKELESMGVTDVLLLTGHHGDQIDAYLQSESFTGLQIRTHQDGNEPLGTGGALKAVGSFLPQYFWLTYGDSMVTADLEQAEVHAIESGGLSLMVVLKNKNRWQPSNVAVAGQKVTKYTKTPDGPDLNYIDFGLILLRKSDLELIRASTPCDLSSLFCAVIERSEMLAWPTDAKFHDIGTPEALKDTERWLSLRFM